MNPRSWLLVATRRPAAIQAGLLVLAACVPLAAVFAGTGEEARSAVFVLAGFELGLLAGIVAALRLRLIGGAPRARIARELANGGVVAAAVWAGAALAIGTGQAAPAVIAFASTRFSGSAPTPAAIGAAAEALAIAVITGAAAALAALLAYGVCRGVVLAWTVWNRWRRTRLRWALTHSLLVASLAVAVSFAAVATTAGVMGGFRPDDIANVNGLELSGAQRFIAAIVLQAAPIVIVPSLIAFVIGVVIVPPAAAIAFPVLGRATRRLEALTSATNALRGGDLSARAPVSGEDEIARLQADFNAMAADLERALGELRAERDAVGRLLHGRRELVATVSHELRTPLATLRGYLDSALEHWDGRPAATLHQDLEIMSAETDRLRYLVDDLFTLSRAEAGRLPVHLQPAAVGPLLQRLVTAAAALAWHQGRVEVVVHIPGPLPLAHADPERLEQVVRNLVTNAVRHTPPGGVVLVSAEPEATTLTIQVRDTGAGIAAADLPLIWDRFYRADDAPGVGAGLGLALVKELTEVMGGTALVESSPGTGSCFTIRLPLSPATSHGVTTPPPVLPPTEAAPVAHPRA